jgi:Mn-dependent DtxR family transcriptional regulator
MQASELLALRHRVSDSTLLDWAELEQLLPPRPCRMQTAELARLWHCSQPTVSRRLTRLWDAGLLDYRASGGWYRVRRLGPLPQQPDRVPCADQQNDAHATAGCS